LKNIIFVSGIHGVGKGTLCKKLNREIGFEHYSCSEIIKENSSYQENSKLVSDAEANQRALIKGIIKIEATNIFLDGHFCLLTKDLSIIEIDDSIFTSINPSKIINISCDEQEIANRLYKRDGHSLPFKILQEMQNLEILKAEKLAVDLSIPIYKFQSGENIQELIRWLTN